MSKPTLDTCAVGILGPAIPRSVRPSAAAGSARGRPLAAPPNTASRGGAGRGGGGPTSGDGGGAGSFILFFFFARTDSVIEATGPEGSRLPRGVAVSAVARGVRTGTERLEGQPGTQPPPLRARSASARLRGWSWPWRSSRALVPRRRRRRSPSVRPPGSRANPPVCPGSRPRVLQRVRADALARARLAAEEEGGERARGGPGWR